MFMAGGGDVLMGSAERITASSMLMGGSAHDGIAASSSAMLMGMLYSRLRVMIMFINMYCFTVIGRVATPMCMPAAITGMSLLATVPCAAVGVPGSVAPVLRAVMPCVMGVPYAMGVATVRRVAVTVSCSVVTVRRVAVIMPTVVALIFTIYRFVKIG
jgi:hypothetical protein